MKLFRITIVLAAIAAGLISPAHARVADAAIQPGAIMSSPTSLCTLNFVFRDQDAALYIGTAGHCAAVGQRVLDGDSAEFGTVVFQSYLGVGRDDFALIAIDPARYGDVNPAMRRWGGPNGTSTHTTTAAGDPLTMYGNGQVFNQSRLVKGRLGPLILDDPASFHADLPVLLGDSGSPVLDREGRALGVISGIDGAASTATGTTVQRAVALLRAAGLDISVVPGEPALLSV